MQTSLDTVAGDISNAQDRAQALVASDTRVTADILNAKEGISSFTVFFQETAADLIDVSAIDTEINQLIDSFVERVSDIVRNQVGPCSLLAAAYSDTTASVCDDGQDSVDAYWFAIAIMSFAALILIPLTFKASDRSGDRNAPAITSMSNTFHFPRMQLSRYLIHFEYLFEKGGSADNDSFEQVRCRLFANGR